VPSSMSQRGVGVGKAWEVRMSGAGEGVSETDRTSVVAVSNSPSSKISGAV
jgi:hypothetical protein